MKPIGAKTTKAKNDLPETKDDKKHLQPDEGTLDLPDAADIPGQEHIHVPRMNEFADTTISSADEEGTGVLDKDDGVKISGDPNVSKGEKKALQDAAEKTVDVTDEENLVRARLDELDDDGEPLNEQTDLSGSDLDIPGSEEDDADEEIGEEDEENNSYSLDGEDEDDSVSKE